MSFVVMPSRSKIKQRTDENEDQNRNRNVTSIAMREFNFIVSMNNMMGRPRVMRQLTMPMKSRMVNREGGSQQE